MTIFVTGGSGFVGLNLLEQLLARGESVVSFSLAPPPAQAQRAFDLLPGSLRHVDGDVCDAGAVEEALDEAESVNTGPIRTTHRPRQPTSGVSRRWDSGQPGHRGVAENQANAGPGSQ